MPPRDRTETYSRARRRFLKLSPLALLAGCDYSAGGKTESFLRSFQRFNDWVQSSVFDSSTLAPEYSDDQLTPEDGFRVNGYDTDEPDIDIPNWRLAVEGLVSKPGDYTLQQVTALPKFVKNLRHCCVEGWSMIPQWGGVRMREFMELVGANPNAK